MTFATSYFGIILQINISSRFLMKTSSGLYGLLLHHNGCLRRSVHIPIYHHKMFFHLQLTAEELNVIIITILRSNQIACFSHIKVNIISFLK